MVQNLTSLDGKVALVTGAGSGIGRASAIMLAAAGAQVMVSDRFEKASAETVEIIRSNRGEAEFHCADITHKGEVDGLIAATVRRFGRLDCAHNNAGIETPLALTHETTDTNWDFGIAVNMKGAWLCLRAELEQMLRQGGGSIVNTASAGGLVAVPNNIAYAAAKAGVINMSRTVAIEYATMGIRCNALCPGYTRTGMTDRLSAANPEMMKAFLPPMNRVAEPEEMASVALFLLSPMSTFLSGQAIVVDGGALASP